MIDRRKFTKSLGLLSASIAFSNLKFDDSYVYGHNEKRYTLDKNWKLHLKDSSTTISVKDCHEMVCLKSGEMILLTNHPKNNIIHFNQKGEVSFAGCQNFPGAHGLTLHYDGNTPQLIITDTDLHKVFHTDIYGNILKTIAPPLDSNMYKSEKDFVPTETIVANNGDLYIADGYGMQYIIHKDKTGKTVNIFGGRGDENKHLDNAHGICIDYRGATPTLIITDRNKCCFKRFTMTGDFISTISVPGANVCRPVIKGDYLYAAVLTTNFTGNAKSGFVVILDKKDNLVSCIAGSKPEIGQDKKLKPSYQTIKVFDHPHDVMVDNDNNLYVCQWNSGQVLPYKFIPV
jgi:peptidylamidoglycolate lyase